MEKRIGGARLVGVCGLMGSGKDTVANLIMARRPRQMRRYSFARPLKEGVKAMFGWTDDEIEDRVKKEEVDDFWGFSPRKAMQLLGTEYGRNLLREDLWVHAAEKYHLTSLEKGQSTIITDVRFENEATWVRNYPDSVLIHVVDPHHPKPEGEVHPSERGVLFVPHADHLLSNDKNEGIEGLAARLAAIW